MRYGCNRVAVLEFLAQSHGEALHREQILRMGSEYPQMTEFLIDVESAARAEETLHGVVQPVVG